MPSPKLTHDDYIVKRFSFYVLITQENRNTIEKYIKPGLPVTDHTLQTALCHSCYSHDPNKSDARIRAMGGQIWKNLIRAMPQIRAMGGKTVTLPV